MHSNNLGRAHLTVTGSQADIEKGLVGFKGPPQLQSAGVKITPRKVYDLQGTELSIGNCGYKQGSGGKVAPFIGLASAPSHALLYLQMFLDHFLFQQLLCFWLMILVLPVNALEGQVPWRAFTKV